MVKVKLKVANIIIQIESKFGIDWIVENNQRPAIFGQCDNFLYKGEQNPDVLIRVEIVNRLPEIENAKPIFAAYHFQDRGENWRLFKKGGIYIYIYKPLLKLHKEKKQVILVNRTFNKATAYLLPKADKRLVWNSADIIYEFLQILLINYLALNKQGIFTHSVGLKGLDGKGLLFSGKSGAGKSTMAKLWYKHSKAVVLNDDRIIIRKLKNQFFIFGSPWHGEFSDYLNSRIVPAPLGKIFFIYHSPENIVRKISYKEAFIMLYPAIFPAFWNKIYLKNIVLFCDDLVKNVPFYALGFVNNREIIKFMNKVC